MECPACGFENMPGVERCGRCRAQLEPGGAAAAAEVAPPRAGHLKGIRPLVYALNRRIDRLSSRPMKALAKAFSGAEFVPGEAIAAMLLSAVPGLGHLGSGRRRLALLAAGAWLLLLFLTVNFYNGWTGGLLVGTLVSWHAGVVFDAGRLQRHSPSARDRVMAMALILLIAAIPYMLLHRLARAHIDFVTSPAAFAALDVQQGDVLCVRRRSYALDGLAVGDLVIVSYSAPTSYSHYHWGGRGLGPILAMAGDAVAVSPSGVAVNGNPIGQDALPHGYAPLPAEACFFTVPEGHAFVPLGAASHHAPVGLVAQLWRHTFLVKAEAVQGKVVGVYLPLRRRHALRRAAIRQQDAALGSAADRAGG